MQIKKTLKGFHIGREAFHTLSQSSPFLSMSAPSSSAEPTTADKAVNVKLNIHGDVNRLPLLQSAAPNSLRFVPFFNFQSVNSLLIVSNFGKCVAGIRSVQYDQSSCRSLLIYITMQMTTLHIIRLHKITTGLFLN